MSTVSRTVASPAGPLTRIGSHPRHRAGRREELEAVLGERGGGVDVELLRIRLALLAEERGREGRDRVARGSGVTRPHGRDDAGQPVRLDDRRSAHGVTARRWMRASSGQRATVVDGRRIGIAMDFEPLAAASDGALAGAGEQQRRRFVGSAQVANDRGPGSEAVHVRDHGEPGEGCVAVALDEVEILTHRRYQTPVSASDRRGSRSRGTPRSARTRAKSSRRARRTVSSGCMATVCSNHRRTEPAGSTCAAMGSATGARRALVR